jgi:hypothetical protein
MSFETVRAATHKAIQDLVPTFAGGYVVKVEFDNREVVNTKTQQDPYLIVKLMFVDGVQRDLSDNPTHRLDGQLQLWASVPKGTGSSAAWKLLEHFYRNLHRRRIAPSLFFMASPLNPRVEDGRLLYGVAIPFIADVSG